MLYKRGRTWWYKIKFQGAVIRESSGLTNKSAARDVERKRHLMLKESSAGVSKRKRVPMFSVAGEQYITGKRAEWAPKTAINEAATLRHLERFFGNALLSDIDPTDVGKYRDTRSKAGASPKTISLELGTLRALLRFHDLDGTWAAISKKIKLAKAEKIGRVISQEEETALLTECRNSRSRSLHVGVVVALEACMRLSEIRELRWRQIDLGRRVITVGKSKTDAGEGRAIPMSRRLYEVLSDWAESFPGKKLDHAVFPSENVGQNGSVYNIDLTKPITTWKEGWEAAKIRAGVQCRFHDLRHTGCTRLLDAGVSHPVVAEIMGWSTSTAIRMIKEVYGHISLATRQRAIEQRESFMELEIAASGAQKGAQGLRAEKVTVQ